MAGQLRRGMAAGSRTLTVPGFELFIWPEGDLFYRNRAVPSGAEAAGARSIAAMVEAFAAQDRIPRVELFAELWPDVASGLERAGFGLEMRAPALVLASGPTPPARAAGSRLLRADASPATIVAFLAGARAAFGATAAEHDAADASQLRRDLGSGASIVAACGAADRPLAGATLIGVGADAELAAVWTRPGYEGRGHARDVCRLVLSHFFAAGGELVWLSAAGERSLRLYQGLGFRRVGTQLNYALPIKHSA